MKTFRVVWQIELEAQVKAEDTEGAVVEVCNLDCQNEGSYVKDSFEIVKVEEALQ